MISKRGSARFGRSPFFVPDGYDWELRKAYYLASPFSMDGLTEIRINGSRILLN